MNQDIITSLRNAIDHGDSLESAKQIMINSGYNPQDVEKASQFIAGGVTQNQQPQLGEQLTMPNQKKSFLSKFKLGQKKPIPIQQTIATPVQQTTTTLAQPLQQIPVSPKQIKQEIIARPKMPAQQVPRTIQQVNQQPKQPQIIQAPTLGSVATPTQKELQKIKPKQPGHTKEIMLLVLLLALIGILITTIVLKDTILGWFSG